jgi:ATP-dependent Lhr-like helicase
VRPDDDSCVIVDSGHVRRRDLALELPPVPLAAVMSGEAWTTIYDRLATLVREHRTTLVFVNTRRLAERAARHLSERLGERDVAAHHGSLAKEARLDAEQRLKRGELRVLVATASLELGIDIGDVELVCQLGSPHSINAFLQRAGRSGHAVGGTPKARVFPLSRDDLVECTALLAAVARGELDRTEIPENALDVLAQQIVAEVAAADWSVDELYATFCRAYPFRRLERTKYDDVLRMLADGFSTRRGRHGALIHHDGIGHMLRGRRGARLTAITSGGTIPDNADYKVLLEPDASVVGTLNEDFAVESLAGDVFQLGNASYRILRVERGTVRVEDARGQPPTIPFWLGEAPGRSDELSAAVSRLRREIEQQLDAGVDQAVRWLVVGAGLEDAAARQLAEYLAAGHAALGALPTQDTVILERFFDEAGGTQLVVHSPFGSRINRAWGLALRKRFCRQFNFELQAAATEDNIVLSLTTAHSFELESVARYLNSATVRPLLIQALLAAPMFGVRWRRTAGVALALPRFRGGRRLPAPILRMNAEDLLAAVFPDQVACAENLPGEIEIPDHPLVAQSIRDCLDEAMDIDAFENVLRRIESGDIRVLARDLTEPSPLAQEVLSARPYAYLDDAPLEERRTQAVMSRRWMDPESAADLGRLDTDAIRRVRDEAWPDAASADELHDALMWLGFLTDDELRANPGWPSLAEQLLAARRIVAVRTHAGNTLWIAAERRDRFDGEWRDEALVEILRGRLEGMGPTTCAALAGMLDLSTATIERALIALEVEGFAMRGRYDPEATADQWVDRRLLARIHRYTVKRLRAEIEPVQARDFLRFLFEWQRVLPESRMRGPDAVAAVVSQLEAYEAPAGAWETEILPARIEGYEPEWLDEHCLAGRFVWRRLAARATDRERGASPVRSTPIVLVPRRNARIWSACVTAPAADELTSSAQAVAAAIAEHGASFFDDLVEHSGLLPTQVEMALAELVALGVVNSDSFGGLRALLVPADRRRPVSGARRRRAALFGMADAGRWALTRRSDAAQLDGEAIEHIVRTLLARWGVIFWALLTREAAWLPPWRELIACCRRLEARGDLRGGRFVAGFSGEQYALPEAVGLLREVRRRPPDGKSVSLSAADPLNLVGILTPGARLPALTGNRVLYRDGLPVAWRSGGEASFAGPLDSAEAWALKRELERRQVPVSLSVLA